METAERDMLKKIVADYRDFEGVGDGFGGSLQKERLEANIEEAEEILKRKQ